MRFSTAIVALSASVASASYLYRNETNVDPECYTTIEVVSQYETYCSEPTTFVKGTKTYEVTEPTTLTIDDCPYGCTITKTYTPAGTGKPDHPGKGYPSHPGKESPSQLGKGYPAPPKGTGSSYPVSGGNSTKPGQSSPTPSTPEEGGAGRVTIAGGALGGLFAIMVYLL